MGQINGGKFPSVYLFVKLETYLPKNTIFKSLILSGLFIFLVYFNSLNAGWHLDDKPNILNNQRIQIHELSWETFHQAANAQPGSGGLYRPVVCLTLGLNWFFGQNDVRGYHLVNLTIHLSTALFLFLVVRLLFETPRFKKIYKPTQIHFIAICTVLFWALNPIQTQAVTYIVQRMASMAGMFSIIAIYFYLKGRLTPSLSSKFLFLTAGLLNYAFAFLCKENAAAILLCMPMFELLFFRHKFHSSQLKKQLIYFGITVCAFFILAHIIAPGWLNTVNNYYVNRPFTIAERVMTEQRILLFYLSQIFFPAPWRLSIEHDITLSTSLLSPWTTTAAIITNLALIVAAVWFRKKHPFFSLAVLFYYLNHIIESTILPLELVFEHRNYLPSFFIFLPIAIGIQKLLIHVDKRKVIKCTIFILLSLIFTLEGYATYERNKAWKSEKSLWLDALQKAPNSARPLAVLSIKLAWEEGASPFRLRKALELTEKTLSLRMARNRYDAGQLSNMANIYNKLGEPENAWHYYQRALTLQPQNVNIRYSYAKSLIMAGSFLKAKEQVTKILNQGAAHADYHHILGFIYLRMDQPNLALSSLQKAIHLSPNRPDILMTLGKSLSSLGYHERAQWFFSLSREKGRDDPALSLCIIENALLSQKQNQAVKELMRATHRFNLQSLIRPLKDKTYNRFREVPYNREQVYNYIQRELIKHLK